MDGWHNLLSEENIMHWLETYKGWGWWPGVTLPFAEALIPILPLIAIIIANAAAYGIWKGMLLSEIGAVLGSILVYLWAKKYGKRLGNWIKRKFPKSKKLFKKLENKGFVSIFLLSCFPFTPSVMLNLAAGINKMPFFKFVAGVALGKAVVIGVFSLIGHNLQHLLHRPWMWALIAVGLLLIWLIWRKMNKDEQPSG